MTLNAKVYLFYVDATAEKTQIIGSLRGTG